MAVKTICSRSLSFVQPERDGGGGVGVGGKLTVRKTMWTEG